MKDFDQWLNESKKQLEDSVLGLFSDSLKCFKNDIDRPAYLLAYQGMMMHLRYVIKNGKRPDCFEEGEWNDILKKIQNDTGWDEEVFNRVKQEASPNKNKQVICIPHEVRTKFDYWREIRNVCAHYKEYKFIKAHTLTLYSFISQYLLRMTIEGGKESLLEEFAIHFDPIRTSPNAPIKSHLEKILKLVPKNELSIFFKELLDQTPRYKRDGLLIDLYADTSLKTAFIEFLRKKENIKYKQFLIYNSPQRVIEIVDNEDSSVRQFWKSELEIYPNRLSILCQMLESGMISPNDTQEVMDDYMAILYKYNSTEILVLSEIEKNVLLNKGFFNFFFSKYFNKKYMSKKYQEINHRKIPFFISFLKCLGMTDEVVTGIVDIFNNGYYPYTLKSNIQSRILDGDEKLREEFENKCNSMNLSVPNCLNKN